MAEAGAAEAEAEVEVEAEVEAETEVEASVGEVLRLFVSESGGEAIATKLVAEEEEPCFLCARAAAAGAEGLEDG